MGETSQAAKDQIKKLVDEAPPLSPAQRDRIRALFRTAAPTRQQRKK